MIRSFVTLLACVAVTWWMPAAASAQRGDTPTPLGRSGAFWDADMQIAKEQLAEFEAGLAALSDAEWRDQSVAWADVELRLADRRISVPRSFHVADVDAGKRAEVEADILDEAWYIAFPKKAPKEIELILTDNSATRVSCPLPEAPEEADGTLGIFVLETRIFCFFREIKEETPA